MGKGRTLENTYISYLCNGPHNTYLSLVMFWFYCCYLSFWVVWGRMGNGRNWHLLSVYCASGTLLSFFLIYIVLLFHNNPMEYILLLLSSEFEMRLVWLLIKSVSLCYKVWMSNMSESLDQGLALIGAQPILIFFPRSASMAADLVSKSDLNLLTSFSPSFSQHLWHNGVVTLKLHFFCHSNLHIANDSIPCTSASPPAPLSPTPPISL